MLRRDFINVAAAGVSLAARTLGEGEEPMLSAPATTVYAPVNGLQLY